MEIILSHANVDFDGIGSMAGAALLYPEATLVEPAGAEPAVREFLLLHESLLPLRAPREVNAEAVTRAVLVDCQARGRLGSAAALLARPGIEVHVYDHHPEEVPDLPIAQRVVAAVGACATVVTQELRRERAEVNAFTATALLLGIYEDTGSLAYAGTTAEDVEAAAWLLRRGADLEAVARFLRRTLTAEQRALLRELLRRAEHVAVRGVDVALAVVPAGAYVEDLAGLAPRLMDLLDARVLFILAPTDHAVHVVGRSRTNAAHVGRALAALDGGGHARAGAAVARQLEVAEVQRRLLAALEAQVTSEPTARQIMSHPARAVPPDVPVDEARRRMIRYGHSGLLVMEGERLVGIITRRDADRARHHRLGHAPVRAFMTRDVVTVSPETPLSEIEERMVRRNVGRLPVVEDGRVLGILTRTDVLRARHGERYLRGARPEAEETVSRLLAERLPALLQELLREVGHVAADLDAQVYAVGGFVRDLLLGVRNLDVDLLVEPDGILLAEAVAARRGGVVTAHRRFGTATLTLPNRLELEFATARTESYPYPGALPEVEPSSIVDDLRRRDFTINALAINLRPEAWGALLDPFGGEEDLERRVVRVLHNLSFMEDPTRILRAIRYEQRYQFRMDPQTEALARQSVADGDLGRISPERLRAELGRVFRERAAPRALKRLEELSVLAWLAPGARADARILEALPGALEWLARYGEKAERRPTYLAALFLALDPEAVAHIARERLRLSPTEADVVRAGVVVVRDLPGFLRAGPSPAVAAETLGALPPPALAMLRAACPDPIVQEYL
ncbi:MAG: CBS domain-containing protein, partial [Armatimonadetes bacterium]|nr:CBS domain-containing protein [Armatimonadota bacterium]